MIIWVNNATGQIVQFDLTCVEPVSIDNCTAVTLTPTQEIAFRSIITMPSETITFDGKSFSVTAPLARPAGINPTNALLQAFQQPDYASAQQQIVNFLKTFRQ